MSLSSGVLRKGKDFPFIYASWFIYHNIAFCLSPCILRWPFRLFCQNNNKKNGFSFYLSDREICLLKSRGPTIYWASWKNLAHSAFSLSHCEEPSILHEVKTCLCYRFAWALFKDHLKEKVELSKCHKVLYVGIHVYIILFIKVTLSQMCIKGRPILTVELPGTALAVQHQF